MEEKTLEGSIVLDQVYRHDVDTSSVDERRLLRKIDLHVIPWLALLYLLNFMDRGSIGNAAVSYAFTTFLLAITNFTLFLVVRFHNRYTDFGQPVSDSSNGILLPIRFI